MRARSIRQVEHDVVAVPPGQLLLDLRAVRAEERVLVSEAERVERDAALFLEITEEVEHHLRVVLVVEGGPEEPLEAAPGEEG